MLTAKKITPPAEQPPVAPAPPETLAAPAPAEQPPVAPTVEAAPASLLVIVRRTIGHAGRTWEPGEVLDVAVFEAIPGCDVERLIAKGALELEG